MRRLAVLVVLVGCSAGGGDSTVTADAGAGGDALGCGLAISFDPMPVFGEAPVASSIAPIRAHLESQGTPGVITYTWNVSHDGMTLPTMQESSEGNDISFVAEDPGIYYVSVSFSGSTASCDHADATLTVYAPGANTGFYRLRSQPPAGSTAPPQEQVIQITGGGDISRDIALDPGVPATGVVRNGASGPGVQAYLKFIPNNTPGAFRELFTQASGAYSTRLVGVMQDVIVIPVGTTALAPKLVQWAPVGPLDLVIGPGTLVSGTITGPAGGALAGAKIQLSANGVPSTVGLSAGNGSFSLRADFPSGSMVTVKVTPPATSGLPRLEAIGAFTLGAAMTIAYSASIQTCDLQNTPVKRSNSNQAGAKVTVVGTLAAIAGTVTAGVAANASGSVRIAASTDGSGRLPAGTLVPRASTLSAVTELGTDDFAVDALDTSACSVAQIDAPPLVAAAGTTKLDATTAIGGIRIEATPVGALALADAQTIAAVSNTSTGAFSLSLASGGLYDVRFIDPYARVAQRLETDLAPGQVPTSAIMPVALRLAGKLTISGTSDPLPAAPIQLLCTQCTGVTAARAIAETATDVIGQYTLAVPDPGTM